MSSISAGTTTGTALVSTGDTTGELVLKTNGSTTAVTIDTSQNVGIGTASPGAKLNVVANTSSDAVRITQTGAGNALLVEDEANPDSSPVVINADGRLVLGTTSANNVLVGSKVQVSGTAGDAFIQAVRFNGVASGNDPGYILGRSYGSSFSSRSAVVAETALGSLIFAGDDGTNWVQGARIQAFVDGTPGTNDMPGRLVFATTADGSSSPTERMRITSDGYLRMASGTGGIQFNGDTAAANALDDYEEGTFTPFLGGSSVDPTGVTYVGAQVGFYTKIGRMVHAYGRIVFTTYTGGSGFLLISGMPFSASSAGFLTVGTMLTEAVAFGTSKTQVCNGITDGGAALYLYGYGSSVNYDALLLTTAAPSSATGKYLQFNIVYQAS